MRSTFACLVIVALAAPAFAADEKVDVEKLYGSWKMTKSESLPPGATAVFTIVKGGEASAVIEVMGQKIELKAKWKLEGNKFTIISKEGDKEVTDVSTITKLTAEDLVMKDDKDGKSDEFKKVKDEKK